MKIIKTYWPGTRVLVFDGRLFVDDVETPLSMTLKTATVVRWYGEYNRVFGNYPNLIDVEFDHRPNEISRGHFAGGVYAPHLNEKPHIVKADYKFKVIERPFQKRWCESNAKIIDDVNYFVEEYNNK